jgi:hypothetical protein
MSALERNWEREKNTPQVSIEEFRSTGERNAKDYFPDNTTAQELYVRSTLFHGGFGEVYKLNQSESDELQEYWNKKNTEEQK